MLRKVYRGCLTTMLLMIVLFSSTGATFSAHGAALRQDETQEEARELDALATYLSYYQVAEGQITAFGNWHTEVWTTTAHLDTSYFRTVCNTVAVGALYKTARPDAVTPDVSWDRLKAMLVSVMQEYADNPTTPEGPSAKDGWGYGGIPNGPLQWDTGFVGYPCLMATALSWEHLTEMQQIHVSTVLQDLASRVYQERTVSFYTDLPTNCTNSLAEEASADAAFLAAASQFYRHDVTASQAWRERAQDLMQAVAFDQVNPREDCYAPQTGAYTDTVTNHGMYPHPNYGLSVTDNIARALLPWAAQGVTLKTNPVTDITPLDATAGNDRLYGTATDSPAKARQIYDANVAYVAVDSDFSLVGQTYQAAAITQTHPSNPITFTDRSYLGKSGVSDWAFGADFQSSSFALGAWLYRTYYRPYKLYLPLILANFSTTSTVRASMPRSPSALAIDKPAYLVENYRNLIEHQAMAPGYAYLPTRHIEGCGESAQLGSGWRHDYLTATCTALLQGPLVEYYVPSNLSLSGQVNTHFFLNSFGALNHVVAYMYVRSTPYWPVDASGSSTLPDFNAPLLAESSHPN